jgi:hypothetical protein
VDVRGRLRDQNVKLASNIPRKGPLDVAKDNILIAVTPDFGFGVDVSGKYGMSKRFECGICLFD